MTDTRLEEFFSHENQPYPSSLSELLTGTKSDLKNCLDCESVDNTVHAEAVVTEDGILAQVHWLRLDITKQKTFEAYTTEKFLLLS